MNEWDAIRSHPCYGEHQPWCDCVIPNQEQIIKLGDKTQCQWMERRDGAWVKTDTVDITELRKHTYKANWVLVPIEPTEAMLNAVRPLNGLRIWSDMILASPARSETSGELVNEKDINQALTLALALLGQAEPTDARAMSDEFVAMAAAQAGIQNQEGRDIIAARLKLPFASIQAEVTFVDTHPSLTPSADADEMAKAVNRLKTDADYFDNPEEGAETHRRALCWVARDIRTVLGISALKSTSAQEE